jgi:puromycin-sensitive aminopeptidase
MLAKFLISTIEPLMRKDLSQDVLPSHYDLSIKADIDSFSGSVVMHLTAKEPVTTFKFNSKDLKLADLKVTSEDVIVSSSFTEKEEFVTVALASQVQGDFTLSVLFSSPYSSSMEGFYKSKYNENDLYSTHFEATDARKAFPCFDQPDMKATFSISIEAPEGFIALSNNSLKEKKGNLHIFNKTPKMSTYIVAFVIGKLDYIEDTSLLPIRVYADASEKL